MMEKCLKLFLFYLPAVVAVFTFFCFFLPSDVNVAFQQAAHKVLLDDDNLLPLLHLTVDYQGKDGKGLLMPLAYISCSADQRRFC